MSTDWLSHSREAQLAMARNWTSVIPQKVSAWAIPSAQLTELVSFFNTAQAALLKAQSDADRTSVVTAQCNAAFKALTDKMRFFKKHYLFVPPLTEAVIP
jgi:alpha-beta hydrolase superfamily lysophospholipase